MANYKNKKSGIPWWAIVVCFCCGLWPVGIVLLIYKLGKESGAFSSSRSQPRDQYGRFVSQQPPRPEGDPYRTVKEDADSYRQQKQTAKSATASRSRASATASQPRASAYTTTGYSTAQAGRGQVNGRMKRQGNKLKNAKMLTIIGAAVMGVFGFSSIMAFADSFSYLFYEPLWLLEDVLPLFIFTGVGAGLFTMGRVKQSQARRYRRYVTLIGEQNEVSISALAAAYPAKRDACCTTLENMIEDGILGDGAYLDYGRDVLVLDGQGVRAQVPKQEKKKKGTPETDIGEENALLRQIREVNDAIENPEMSRKIDRIGEITERILEFQKEHPDKAGGLRKFLNYYLPTTLKILNSYAELEKQGVEGENIAATKQRIENMMDMVVEGFERQLDKLFAGDMLDIAADITVMEQMMQGDGLFDGDDDGMGLGGH